MAQSELGRRLARKKKYKEALHWFRLAARDGDPERQIELGLVLCWDCRAFREGFRWVRRAAEQGHMGAQYFLGSELATGENVRKRVDEAAKWYRRAARLGHAEAQYNLAMMYWLGEGVPRNVQRAHRWLERSARLGDLVALRAVAEAYEAGQMGYRKNAALARRWRTLYNRASERMTFGHGDG